MLSGAQRQPPVLVDRIHVEVVHSLPAVAVLGDERNLVLLARLNRNRAFRSCVDVAIAADLQQVLVVQSVQQGSDRMALPAAGAAKLPGLAESFEYWSGRNHLSPGILAPSNAPPFEISGFETGVGERFSRNGSDGKKPCPQTTCTQTLHSELIEPQDFLIVKKDAPIRLTCLSKEQRGKDKNGLAQLGR